MSMVYLVATKDSWTIKALCWLACRACSHSHKQASLLLTLSTSHAQPPSLFNIQGCELTPTDTDNDIEQNEDTSEPKGHRQSVLAEIKV